MNPCPKQPPNKDPAYLSWVRKQPCVITGKTPCEAHHFKSRGSGGGDYTALPLITEEHVRCHMVGAKTFWLDYDIKQIIIDHLTRYIKSMRGKNEIM